MEVCQIDANELMSIYFTDEEEEGEKNTPSKWEWVKKQYSKLVLLSRMHSICYPVFMLPLAA
jgi:hypothetical protein